MSREVGRVLDEHRQAGFRVRFDWGPNGLRALAPVVDTVVVVDVLSFSTSVDIATARGAVVLPYRWHNGSEHEYARQRSALVASADRAGEGYTLSTSSLESVPAATRLVLPSPNGSALCFGAHEAGAKQVVVGCLRNARAVGRWVLDRGGIVGVLAAGERWRGATGPMRPALEDLLGSGAIIAALDGDGGVSPEASVAAAAFAAADVGWALRDCASGRELVSRGFDRDVELAGHVDASTAVPVLQGDELVAAGG